MANNSHTRTITALAWCLAWGKEQKLVPDKLSVLHQMRQRLLDEQNVPESTESFVEQARKLYEIPETYFPKPLQKLHEDYPTLWEQETPIGLVYGGATKIKQYVFEAAKLPDIRGASALLDRINLVDLKAFFGEGTRSPSIEHWLDENEFADLRKALIPELIIYSTGGSILAFCPAGFVHQLANAIEKRYTDETLTANSCAVGETFRLLELRFGLLQNPIGKTFWLEKYQEKQDNRIIKAYFDQVDVTEPEEKFRLRKNFSELVGKLANLFTQNFSELVGKLANLFTQRRNGNDLAGVERPSRCYPPMFETHPYLQRDESDRRSAVAAAKGLPREPWFSDALARKHIVGQRTKREDSQGQGWYNSSDFGWQSGQVKKLWKSGKVLSVRSGQKTLEIW